MVHTIIFYGQITVTKWPPFFNSTTFRMSIIHHIYAPPYICNKCSSNAPSMLLGCSSNAHLMLNQCSLNAQLMLIECLIHLCMISQNFQWNKPTLRAGCIYVPFLLLLLLLLAFFECSSNALQMLIRCSSNALRMLLQCSLNAQSTYV